MLRGKDEFSRVVKGLQYMANCMSIFTCTLETHAMSLQKLACTFPIFHAVVLLDSGS